MAYMILAVNPGSASTKIGLFGDAAPMWTQTIYHDGAAVFSSFINELPMRRQAVLDTLESHSCRIDELDAVVGRGGILPPVHTGGYIVNDAMTELLRSGTLTPHASNLGGLLANEIAALSGRATAYIYDSVSAHEFPPIAQITGFAQIRRNSICHVLNSRAVARQYAQSQGGEYEQMSLLVAHLGGGISISAHERGRIIDSIADDGGPFSPERAGNAPLLDVIELCYSGRYSKDDMIRQVRGTGGLKAHLGTSDLREIENRMLAGDEQAAFMLEVQAYQVAKGIGQLAPVFGRACDAILLTGGGARCEFLTQHIASYISWMAPVAVIPGEYELEALAEGALRLLRGEEQARAL